ncbi:hypothetical protein [Kitasatospora purpeofusca]
MPAAAGAPEPALTAVSGAEPARSGDEILAEVEEIARASRP